MIRQVLGMMAAMSMTMGMANPAVSQDAGDTSSVRVSPMELFCRFFPNYPACRGAL